MNPENLKYHKEHAWVKVSGIMHSTMDSTLREASLAMPSSVEKSFWLAYCSAWFSGAK